MYICSTYTYRICISICIYVVYTYRCRICSTVEYYSAIKSNEIIPFVAAWIDLEIILNEVTQTWKRQMSYAITYIWNLYDTNELIYKMETDRYRKHIYSYQRKKRGRD